VQRWNQNSAFVTSRQIAYTFISFATPACTFLVGSLPDNLRFRLDGHLSLRDKVSDSQATGQHDPAYSVLGRDPPFAGHDTSRHLVITQTIRGLVMIASASWGSGELRVRRPEPARSRIEGSGM
jgi:hypothetical protein